MAEEREEDAKPDADDDDQTFERVRGALLGLAYRMLGSRTEAEDAVQDTFVRWQEAERRDIRNAAAWLTMTCTRRCIDLLRRAERHRLDDVGAWLPEHVLQGKQAVITFVRKFLHRMWSTYTWTVVDLNGARAVLLDNGGVIVTAVAIGFDQHGVATHIYILRNPDKLASLSMASIHTWAGGLA